MFLLLCLTYFIQYNNFEVHPCCVYVFLAMSHIGS